MSVEKAVDRCVQCGFCLSACPTYRLFDREESSPRGRIALAGALLRGELSPTADVLATFGECLGCRACETACPSGVPYEEILLYGRGELRKRTGPPPLPARLLLAVVSRPFALNLAASVWRILGDAVQAAVRWLGPRRGPAALLAAAPGRRPPVRVRASAPADVVVHRGCLMEVFWSTTNDRAVGLLQRAGYAAAWLPRSSGCCGALAAHQGDLASARRSARRVIEAFEASGATTVVNLAGGCSAFLREYPLLFDPTDPWRARAERLAATVRDVASLLAGRLPAPTRAPSTGVTYQDSCHLRHGLRIHREPRALLRSTGDFRELPGADTCCGSAGIYNLLRPDVADRLLAAKTEAVAALGVDVLVVSNPGCELQLRLGVRRAGLPVSVRHLVDHLWELGAGEGADSGTSVEC